MARELFTTDFVDWARVSVLRQLPQDLIKPRHGAVASNMLKNDEGKRYTGEDDCGKIRT